MKFRSFLTSLALCCAATSAMAAVPSCDNTSRLAGGSLGGASLGNSFSSAGTYKDCFTFSLAGQANSLAGSLIRLDPLVNKLNIGLESVSLYLGATSLGKSTSPLAFSFTKLAGGAAVYTLQVVSKVSAAVVASLLGGNKDPVGYRGKITPLASPAPEPAAYALVIAGFAIVGIGAWRRRRL